MQRSDNLNATLYDPILEKIINDWDKIMSRQCGGLEKICALAKTFPSHHEVIVEKIVREWDKIFAFIPTNQQCDTICQLAKIFPLHTDALFNEFMQRWDTTFMQQSLVNQAIYIRMLAHTFPQQADALFEKVMQCWDAIIMRQLPCNRFYEICTLVQAFPTKLIALQKKAEASNINIKLIDIKKVLAWRRSKDKAALQLGILSILTLPVLAPLVFANRTQIGRRENTAQEKSGTPAKRLLFLEEEKLYRGPKPTK